MEWKNLAADPKFADVKRDLAKWLPKTDAQPSPGSRRRRPNKQPPKLPPTL